MKKKLYAYQQRYNSKDLILTRATPGNPAGIRWIRNSECDFPTTLYLAHLWRLIAVNASLIRQASRWVQSAFPLSANVMPHYISCKCTHISYMVDQNIVVILRVLNVCRSFWCWYVACSLYTAWFHKDCRHSLQYRANLMKQSCASKKRQLIPNPFYVQAAGHSTVCLSTRLGIILNKL